MSESVVSGNKDADKVTFAWGTVQERAYKLAFGKKSEHSNKSRRVATCSSSKHSNKKVVGGDHSWLDAKGITGDGLWKEE